MSIDEFLQARHESPTGIFPLGDVQLLNVRPNTFNDMEQYHVKKKDGAIAYCAVLVLVDKGDNELHVKCWDLVPFMTKPMTTEDFDKATQDEQMDAINSILQNIYDMKVIVKNGEQMATLKSGSEIDVTTKHSPKKQKSKY